MSTLIKKIRLFDNKNTPITYKTINNKNVITPTLRLNRRTETGLVTSKKLTNAKTKEEHAYVREAAKYYLVIGKHKEVHKLVKSMNPTNRRLFFNKLTLPQLIEYFVSLIGPIAYNIGKKMKKHELVNIATTV